MNAISTPDRFLTLPALAIVMVGCEGLRLCSREIAAQRLAIPIFLIAILCSCYYVANAQQVWTNQQDYGLEEPSLDAVNRVARDIGPPYRAAGIP